MPRLLTIAGYCTEAALWKLMADLCQIAESDKQLLPTPANITVDGTTFLVDATEKPNGAFLPPEMSSCQRTLDGEPTQQPDVTEAQQVWAIGATVYYASSGHPLFGGHGGSYQQQHPDVALPALQKVHEAVTPVMQRCLAALPQKRISLRELKAEADKHGTRTGVRATGGVCDTPNNELHTPNNELHTPQTARNDATSWPEEMTSI